MENNSSDQQQQQQDQNSSSQGAGEQGQDQRVTMTQEQLDEFQTQIKLNEDYQNQLKQEIEEQMPFISELTELSVLKHEYQDNKFELCFDQLATRYSKVRRLRRDGNCFYRAFLFQVFEHFIHNPEDPQYEQILKVLVGSKKDLMDLGYDEIAIEDFYDLFLDEFKKLKTIAKAKAAEHLLKLLCNKEEAVYIIMFARFLAACYLKQNAIMFEGFVGDVAQFCMREVEQVDVECDQPQIIAITNYLGLGVEINSVRADGGIEVINLPEEGYSGFRAKLLFVPGHYDALYQ
ncbi:ubiquitin thioesterase otub1 [Stylonychia lemnae]|uniref:ubiquitinyl hydrolase 1 n=1 Tax=Stylonychia lemnae TaxID=5949 RepID=A0A077ZYU7_STYLE|nr:ubiquitin thioesterase otub1 [Stylonychia lemnae]|eukprot:CDW75085.1 ubiquitin thioesterase otub1 [Stylonychia lemnae]